LRRLAEAHCGALSREANDIIISAAFHTSNLFSIFIQELYPIWTYRQAGNELVRETPIHLGVYLETGLELQVRERFRYFLNLYMNLPPEVMNDIMIPYAMAMRSLLVRAGYDLEPYEKAFTPDNRPPRSDLAVFQKRQQLEALLFDYLSRTYKARPEKLRECIRDALEYAILAGGGPTLAITPRARDQFKKNMLANFKGLVFVCLLTQRAAKMTPEQFKRLLEASYPRIYRKMERYRVVKNDMDELVLEDTRRPSVTDQVVDPNNPEAIRFVAQKFTDDFCARVGKELACVIDTMWQDQVARGHIVCNPEDLTLIHDSHQLEAFVNNQLKATFSEIGKGTRNQLITAMIPYIDPTGSSTILDHGIELSDLPSSR
jgi:hypothetical protein